MEDTSDQQGRKKELKVILARIEADIKKACDEEDYDKAGMYRGLRFLGRGEWQCMGSSCLCLP